ncbi:MAG: ABC transporter permease [Gammaproteobacteria bacterium]|nr:MAG: ABC transporter permease [Gammaproteobacteria bacterium]
MGLIDTIKFSFTALERYRMRTSLMLLAMAIGVASVVVLTSLGEGARRYVTGQFSSLGSNLLIVLPGRSETTGGSPNMLVGETPRDLTIDDAQALLRSSSIRRIAPINVGSAPVSWKGRERDVSIIGSTSDLLDIRHWEMGQGKFLPRIDPDQSSPVSVIGANIRRELFGPNPALGQWIRIGEHRFRVIGVMASEGRSIGIDVEDLVIIPVASAQSLFNSFSLFRILIEATSRDSIPAARKFILNTVTERHQGEKDITVVTQDAVLQTFDKIFDALTYAVGGIAAISLSVGGILIMNVMLITVSQRTAEIGLLKALGATRNHITLIFIAEAILLSLLGAILGIIIGEIGSWFIGISYPQLPVGAPWWAVTAALAVALFTGLLFGTLPARQAARLDPVRALQRR